MQAHDRKAAQRVAFLFCTDGCEGWQVLRCNMRPPSGTG